MTHLLLWLQILLAQWVPVLPATHAAGSTPPAFVSAVSNVSIGITGSNFPTAGFTTAAGDLVWVIEGVKNGTAGGVDCGNFIASSQIGGVASGDSWTAIPLTGYPFSGGSICGIAYVSFNVHASSGSNYVFNVQDSTIGQAYTLYALAVFHPGSLTATDTNCTASTAGATSLSCSSAMTPGATLELVLGGLIAYDGGAISAGSGYTIPSGGSYTSSVGNGGAAVEYLIANPTSGTYTPGFPSFGLGDSAAVVGSMLK